MYLLLLALLTVFQLHGADEQRIALTLRGQASFDRVASTTSPTLADTGACRQSQAALLAVAPRTEAPLIHFRKGYCTLAAGVLTGHTSEFTAAAADFDKAIQSWPERERSFDEDRQPEPVSAGLRALAVIARLKAGESPENLALRNELGKAVDSQSCPASVMPADMCHAILKTGREWLGWINLMEDNLYGAGRYFSNSGSGWSYWVSGKAAFAERNYAEAASEYKKAVEQWYREANEAGSSLLAGIRPRPEMSQALTELGGAQLVAGDPPAAIATLDAAIRIAPRYSWAIYLRGRAKEKAGQTEAALADYNLASRTAFAAAEDLASGEAHFYRGVMLYRRDELERAEEEFSSALNFEISDRLRPDAEAWRYMAAVADGACDASRERLERSLETASPFFPKAEARTLAISCTGPSTRLRVPDLSSSQ